MGAGMGEGGGVREGSKREERQLRKTFEVGIVEWAKGGGCGCGVGVNEEGSMQKKRSKWG